MARGGYQIIDLKNVPIFYSLSNEPDDDDFVKIDGIFELIKRVSKPLYFTNVMLNNGESVKRIPEFIGMPIIDNDNIIINLPDLSVQLYIDETKGLIFFSLYLNSNIAIDKPLTNGINGIGIGIDDTLTIDSESGKLGVDMTELPINDTLEIDTNGKLGVAYTVET